MLRREEGRSAVASGEVFYSLPQRGEETDSQASSHQSRARLSLTSGHYVCYVNAAVSGASMYLRTRLTAAGQMRVKEY